MTDSHRPGGHTLPELMVVLMVLAVVLGMASMAFGSLADRDAGSHAATALQAARREALVSGRAVVVLSDSTDPESRVLFLPDGRAIGEGSIPEATGEPRP